MNLNFNDGMEHLEKQLTKSDYANQSTILTGEEDAGAIVPVVLDEVYPLAIKTEDNMDQVDRKNNIEDITREGVLSPKYVEKKKEEHMKQKKKSIGHLTAAQANSRQSRRTIIKSIKYQ